MLAVIEFDTLNYANELEEAGFTKKQAEVQAVTLKKFITSNLSTKQDILIMQKDIAETKADLQKDLAETKADLQKEIAESKADLQKNIEKNAQIAKQNILMLQKDIAETKGDLQKEIAEIKGDC